MIKCFLGILPYCLCVALINEETKTSYTKHIINNNNSLIVSLYTD